MACEASESDVIAKNRFEGVEGIEGIICERAGGATIRGRGTERRDQAAEQVFDTAKRVDS